MQDGKRKNQCLRGEDVTPEQWRQIDAVIERYRAKPGALIPVLEEVQEVTGYLPESVQRRVAVGLGLPLSQVYGVVTFYSFFTMVPRGGWRCKGGVDDIDAIAAFHVEPHRLLYQ